MSGGVAAIIALYLLCRSGRLGSYGNTAKLCNVFSANIPGLMLFGGGAIVAIGGKTISLQALLLRLNSSGVGSDLLNKLQSGDKVPRVVLPVGWRGRDIEGRRIEVQGYVLYSIFTEDGSRGLGYRIVRADGTYWNVAPEYINYNGSEWITIN